MDNIMDKKIVIDIGSYYIKVGYSNEDRPRLIVPSTIGRPRFLDLSRDLCDKPHYIGSEAISKKGILALKYPIEYGVVSNWDDMEKILVYIFNELNVNTEEYSVIIAQSPIDTNKNKEEITKVMFETFNVQNLYIGIQQELTLKSIGLKTGLVVDSGDSSTLIVPVIDGVVERNSVVLLKIGGRDITDYLFKLLNENGNKIYQYDKNIVSQVKENFGFISLDCYNEQQQEEKEYQLPAGKMINFTNEVFKAPELIFNPSLHQIPMDSIDRLIYETIMKFNKKEIQKDLFSNIVLTGGNTKFKGFKERLEKEMHNVLSSNEGECVTIKITSTSEPLYSSWLGCSLIETSHYNSKNYSRFEYDKVGPSIIYSK
ncbi:hypothetical protein DICPUDRAFT_88965 [Dictyostelium purpureum]|uniref:Actin n=1 Tax=Dictyostelium purpureum TaxID=5786 RepID=F0ZSV3_DICPU|nr:uncharacterized protein DICPUDRAFT_88965 [Dictyostelium purpureum]EGC32974.1 hypothetical protein DICPUDRAFT_88965 [Dictyostelium purpureum]|eukprot:XP_003290492.1 hypothetical protein DICPUDRAFT_88965 [Dictyostelium purpureum]